MANLTAHVMDVPAAVQAGASIRVDNLTDIGVYVFGTFVQTLQMQVSPDGVEWFNEGAALTTKGKLEVSVPCRFLRVNVTANTSGLATVKIVGEQRQD